MTIFLISGLSFNRPILVLVSPPIVIVPFLIAASTKIERSEGRPAKARQKHRKIAPLALSAKKIEQLPARILDQQKRETILGCGWGNDLPSLPARFLKLRRDFARQ